MRDKTVLFCFFLLLSVTGAQASTITVMLSGGLDTAYKTLTPQFEKASGAHLVAIRGASMGTNPTAIPARLDRGEAADMVILIRGAVDALVAKGQVMKDTVTDLGVGHIAMAVKAGAAKPDIHSVAAFRRALLRAKSVAYTDSAGGVYLQTVLFKRLGIEKEMAAKSTMIKGAPVAPGLARGEYAFAFQQLSELKDVPGVEVVGLIPDALQQTTVFSAGVTTGATNPRGARAFIRFLASPASFAAIADSGLDPAQKHKSPLH